MPEAPFIQQHAIPTEPKFLAKFWSINLKKFANFLSKPLSSKLLTFWTMSHQIQVVIYHREVSKKALLSVLDSKMTRFGAMSHHIQVVIYHPEGSQNGILKSLHFWGSPFLDPFCPDPRAICLKTWSPVQNPLFGPMSPRMQVTIYHIRWSFFNLFLFWVIFWIPSDGKS